MMARCRACKPVPPLKRGQRGHPTSGRAAPSILGVRTVASAICFDSVCCQAQLSREGVPLKPYWQLISRLPRVLIEHFEHRAVHLPLRACAVPDPVHVCMQRGLRGVFGRSGGRARHAHSACQVASKRCCHVRAPADDQHTGRVLWQLHIPIHPYNRISRACTGCSAALT